MSGRRIGGIAVVTGGASGIGAACCRVLADAGATVVVLDRDAARAEAIAEEVKGRAWVADVGDEKAPTHAPRAIEAEIGPVEVLVNSAGVLQMPLRPNELPCRPRTTSSASISAAPMSPPSPSAAACSRAAAAASSTSPRSPACARCRCTPTRPAKAAVIAITECLAAEWGRSGVRVNAVSPGYTLTPALQAAIDKGQRDVSMLNGTRRSAAW